MKIKYDKCKLIQLTTVAVMLVSVPVHAVNVFTDSYDTSVNTNDINFGIGTRTSGTITISGYNEGVPTALDSQTQLQTTNGGVLLLEPNKTTGYANSIWAGPNLNFLGALPSLYRISFDVDPNDSSDTWSGFTFGVTSQGSFVNADHGGLGFIFYESGAWSIFDGTDGTTANVRNGTYATNGFRTVQIDVTESGSNVTVELSIDGVFLASYTLNSTFTGNYMNFQGFTGALEPRPMYFDNFTIEVIPTAPTVGLGGGATDILGDSATLHGELTSGVYVNAYICWGDSAGGDTTGSWQNVISVGAVGDTVFSGTASNLDDNTEYYYRVYVTNDAGHAWSPVTNFVTITLLFYDDFDSADGTSLTDPTGRAIGTVASSVTYTWTSTTDVQVDGTLSWDADGNSPTLNEQPSDNNAQNMRFGLNLGPYVAGKVWEVAFDQRVTWSRPLAFGLSDNVQSGVYNAWDNNNYDFAVGQYGGDLRYDTDNEGGADGPAVAGMFPYPPTDAFYNFRIRFDEPNSTVTVWIDGVQKLQLTTLDFENSGRYLSWGEPPSPNGYYAGALDNIKITAPYDVPAVDAEDIYNFDLNVASSDILSETQAAAGQTFLTGINSRGYILKSLSFFQTKTVTSTAGTFTMRLGTVSGTTFTTNMTATFSGADVSLSGYGNDWVTFTLATPVKLDPKTLYGIDLVRTGGGNDVNWGESGDVYADGESYTSPPNGLGGPTITIDSSKDRIFHFDMEAGPPQGTVLIVR